MFNDNLEILTKTSETGSFSSEDEGAAWCRPVPVIGVFWDIENCQVPRGRSAAAVAQAIRSKLFVGHREVEFVVVCDVTKENDRVVAELNCAKINLMHVPATCKNAADDKLRQRIRHFGETYDPGSTVVLISGDINFSSELIEIRHRRMMRVILLHNNSTSEALKICVNEHYNFLNILQDIPDRCEAKDDDRGSISLWVSNIPEGEPPSRVRARLKQLCYNCGGRVEYVSKHIYCVKLASLDLAQRAQRRMDGQDVFGRKIVVSDANYLEWSRTPGRNRPKKPPQEHLGKPWDVLQNQNTHQPVLNNKVSGIENLRHLNTSLPVVRNDFHKPSNQPPTRLNNLSEKDGGGFVDYRTDSSSCAYDDEDSDEESVPRCSEGSETSGPVDLRVTGLDPQQDLMVTRELLAEALNAYTKVLSLSVFTQADESVVATVKVKSLKEAQLVIANLQRHRLGSHRIKISFHNTTPEQRHLTRCQVAELLLELPPGKMPLFRFKELFKNKYLTSVSVSELRRMRDLCVVSEDEAGRTIACNPWARSSLHLRLPKEYLESPYCDLHDSTNLKYRAEPAALPSVKIGLTVLKDHVTEMLHSHKDRLPLASLHRCYHVHYGPLLVSDTEGVSLEHLVACISGVEIKSQGSIKYLAWEPSNEKPVDRPQSSVSAVTSHLLELLTHTPRATLSFTDFIPAYHRRFGKQFRLSDFGHTKLLDLLESLPHVVQVIGFGSKKMVTLSHRAQMKRFKSDLIKVLKAQPTYSVDLDRLPDVYANHFNRNWEPWQYGVCETQDLLASLSSPEIVLSTTAAGKMYISVIVRQQTPEELQLTNVFRSEVIELLKHEEDCSVPLKQFVPSYHTYFGKQCRVASYGFHKLNDLFEAIADTVTVEEYAGCLEKHLTLTLRERLKVLGERFKTVVMSHGGSIMLAELEASYQASNFGVVEPALYGCGTMHQLLDLLSDYVKVVASPHGYVVIPVQTVDSTSLVIRTRLVFHSKDCDTLPVDQFKTLYQSLPAGQELNVELAMSRIPSAVKMIDRDGVRCVQLTACSIFANRMFTLLSECHDRLPLVNFEVVFAGRFGCAVDAAQLGFPSVSALLSGFPETFTIENMGQSSPKFIVLNSKLYKMGFEKAKSWEYYTLWGGSGMAVVPPDPSALPLPDHRLIQKRRPPTSNRIAAQFGNQ